MAGHGSPRPPDQANHPARKVASIGDDLFEDSVTQSMRAAPLDKGVKSPDDPADFRHDWVDS